MSRFAIYKPTTLVGRELREALEERQDLWSDLRLLSDDDDEIGTLAEIAGEMSLVGRVEPEAWDAFDVVFYCGDESELQPLLASRSASTTVVLVTPELEVQGAVPVVASLNPGDATAGEILQSPHPAAILLAHLLSPLDSFELGEVVATVVQPVSIFDAAALDELFEQSRRVIAMVEPQPGERFDRQLAFNLLPSLAAGHLVVPQLRSLLGGGQSQPLATAAAVSFVQGAVFHSYAANVFVRLAKDPGEDALREALEAAPRVELFEEPDRLGPIDAATRDDVLVGSVRRDPYAEGGYWLWAVMDNLRRGGALNAVEIAEALLSASVA